MNKAENSQIPEAENSQQFKNPTDTALMKFKLSDRKKVYAHAKKAGLRINGFAQFNSFTVLVIPTIEKKADSYLIRDCFTKSYNQFLDAVERNRLLQVLSIYKRVDKLNYQN